MKKNIHPELVTAASEDLGFSTVSIDQFLTHVFCFLMFSAYAAARRIFTDAPVGVHPQFPARKHGFTDCQDFWTPGLSNLQGLILKIICTIIVYQLCPFPFNSQALSCESHCMLVATAFLCWSRVPWPNITSYFFSKNKGLKVLVSFHLWCVGRNSLQNTKTSHMTRIFRYWDFGG